MQRTGSRKIGETMEICKKCILDEHFPGISFDENGICRFCLSIKPRDEQKIRKRKYEKKFREHLLKHRGKNHYDCLVAYSGGKDSTFILHLMQNEYNLNILALSFDNWLQSESAPHNIQNVIMNVNVDHLTIRPSFDIFRKMIRASLSKKLYSMKAMERASAVCTTCLSIIRSLCFKVAIEKSIPFVVLGMSPGQAPVATSVFKANPNMIKKMQNAIYQPLFEHAGEAMKAYFLEEKHFENEDSFPYSINPLAFTDYDEDTMIQIAESYGWVRPMDTDTNSTNCLLNGFANQAHIKQHGFHPYAYEIATLVREGCMTREEGLRRLSTPPDPKVIDYVKQKLGLSDD